MPRAPGPDNPAPKAAYVRIQSPGGSNGSDGETVRAVDETRKSPSRSVSAPMGFASMGSCFVALTNTILGSGMLGLPHAFSSCGYLLGFFFLVAGGLASCLGLHLLVCSAVSARSRLPFSPVQRG